ncbi:uncharacterized protein LOC126973507 isoform X1 [Leptidea sinapis]|uniref:uncharacterized protein LOC126973507 isoform X1 n=1 Tax=Leptidea sinapis TaxID=189913 RepID=UPI0021C40CC2|nr:uncharacterized protein LOC126973507 isoform X1 [Leptidea sinapis]
MTGKLDQITNREWEQHRNSMSQPPTLPVFITFLNSRADLLETLEESKVAKTQNSQAFNNTKPKSFVINTNNNFTNHKSFNHKSSLCQLCNQSHFLFSCPNFRDLPVESRIKKAQDLKVCLNCLRPGHVLSKCKLGSCKYCRLKHNTLLHIENEPEQSTSQNVALTLNNTSETRTVLLSTALVNVVDTNGKLHTARVLLDNGSTANFVSEDFCHASERAYGACVFVRSIHADGSVHVHLLSSKSKVAPIKPATMPRLELCAALMGARLHSKEKSKWHRSTRGELKEGALVVIKDKTSPHLMWLMGRVIRVLPGSDGVARVADIRTRKGVLRRAFNTICPLPLQ